LRLKTNAYPQHVLFKNIGSMRGVAITWSLSEFIFYWSCSSSSSITIYCGRASYLLY